MQPVQGEKRKGREGGGAVRKKGQRRKDQDQIRPLSSEWFVFQNLKNKYKLKIKLLFLFFRFYSCWIQEANGAKMKVEPETYKTSILRRVRTYLSIKARSPPSPPPLGSSGHIYQENNKLFATEMCHNPCSTLYVHIKKSTQRSCGCIYSCGARLNK